jgi:hypothetical protein
LSPKRFTVLSKALVIIGVNEHGKKELIAIEDGYRESTQSWTELLEDIRHRGLSTAPKLAIGDGALGFWNAISKVYPETRHQRCWVHKTANVLNKLPKSVQPKVKVFHYIFLKRYGVTYPYLSHLRSLLCCLYFPRQYKRRFFKPSLSPARTRFKEITNWAKIGFC